MNRVSITIQIDPDDVGTHFWVRMKRKDSDKMGEAWVDTADERYCIAAALHLLLEELRKEMNEKKPEKGGEG